MLTALCCFLDALCENLFSCLFYLLEAGSSAGKESACNSGYPGLIPGSGTESEPFPEPLGTGLDFHKHWKKESNPREIRSETQLRGEAR